MLIWLNPLALFGLLAAAGPVAVHLLRRQRAARVPFASLRFIRTASTSAVRLRLPSDLRLLVLRVAIVCGAAMALAQPLLVTPSRRAVWDGRTSRAIVVDTSPSMAGAASRAAEASVAEAQGSVYATTVETNDVRAGVLRAVDALRAAPPSRREIVIVSDFQRGTLGAVDLTRVPREFGLRFTAVGKPAVAGEFRGDVGTGAPGIEPRVMLVQPTPDGTAAVFSPTETPIEGLRLLDAGPPGDALLRSVARAGAPAPSPDQPIALTFSRNLPNPTSPVHLSRPWMIRTVLAMRRDPALAEAAREHVAAQNSTAVRDGGIVLARDAGNAPVVLAAPGQTELVLIVAGEPADYLAAATLRSALVARRGVPDWAEQEVAQVPAEQLAQWSREAGPFEMRRPADPDMGSGDARWVWLLVLALLGIEPLVRRKAVHGSVLKSSGAASDSSRENTSSADAA